MPAGGVESPEGARTDGAYGTSNTVDSDNTGRVVPLHDQLPTHRLEEPNAMIWKGFCAPTSHSIEAGRCNPLRLAALPVRVTCITAKALTATHA